MALACVTLAAGGQTTNLTTRSLTLRECIDLALEHSLAIQIQRYGPEVAKYTLKAAYGAYDPTLSLSASRTFVDQPPTFDPKKLNQTKPTALNPAFINVPGQDWPYQQRIDSVGFIRRFADWIKVLHRRPIGSYGCNHGAHPISRQRG